MTEGNEYKSRAAHIEEIIRESRDQRDWLLQQATSVDVLSPEARKVRDKAEAERIKREARKIVQEASRSASSFYDLEVAPVLYRSAPKDQKIDKLFEGKKARAYVVDGDNGTRYGPEREIYETATLRFDEAVLKDHASSDNPAESGIRRSDEKHYQSEKERPTDSAYEAEMGHKRGVVYDKYVVARTHDLTVLSNIRDRIRNEIERLAERQRAREKAEREERERELREIGDRVRDSAREHFERDIYDRDRERYEAQDRMDRRNTA